MRFIILGVALIFVGVIVLGAFGHEYQAAPLESPMGQAYSLARQIQKTIYPQTGQKQTQ